MNNMTTGRKQLAWQSVTKVPKINTLFWIIKILTTGMGEALSDYLAHRMNPIFAGAIGFLVFVVALVLQFRTRRYKPFVYWFAVSMVAVFGTMAADGLHVELGIPYVISTLFYAISLAVIFVWWYQSEGTLSVHSIRTKRRETFYWATVLATFAMGTALGDLTAYNLNLGYLTSGILFAVLFVVPGFLRFVLKASPIFTFWFAYIVTRPLGASFADWLGVPKDLGGVNIGRGVVSMSLAIIIFILVTYLSLTKSDSQSHLKQTEV